MRTSPRRGPPSSLETSLGRLPHGHRSGVLLLTTAVLALILLPLTPVPSRAGGTRDFRPRADATGYATRPDRSDGSALTLRAGGWPEARSYLRFVVTSVPGTVRRASLELRVTSPSRSGFEVYLAEGSWGGSRITYAHEPRLVRVLDSSGPVSRADLVHLDVTAAVRGPGTYTFALLSNGTRMAAVASLESGQPAILSITTGAPCSGVRIQPGDSIQHLIDQGDVGTTFCLEAGVHRIQERLLPKDRQRFIGLDGAILNGSKRLTDFQREVGFWVADGQTQEIGPSIGFCQPEGYTGCTLPERVFLDSKSLWQVTSLSDLSPGEFYFDYDGDRIYLADDPAGHLVEASVAFQSFATYSGQGVLVRNLIVEKFGTPASTGTLGSWAADHWRIIGNVVRSNGGIGICGGEDTLVRANHVHDQGQMGLCGQGSGGRYINNTVDHNNLDGFRVYWEAGGSKWVNTEGLVVRGNFFHHNHGMGLWADGSNVRTTFANNRVDRNDGIGILHEISYGASIRDNYVARNGRTTEAALDGAGIMIASSSEVEVEGNTVVDNWDGIVLKQHSTSSGDHGPHVVEDAWIHDNVIVMCRGETGGIQTVGDDAIFTTRHNRYDDNRYRIDRDRDRLWRWMNGSRTRREWLDFGQDRHSRFRQIAC